MRSGNKEKSSPSRARFKKDRIQRRSKLPGGAFDEGRARFDIAVAVHNARGRGSQLTVSLVYKSMKTGQYLKQVYAGARRWQATFVASRVTNTKLGDKATEAATQNDRRSLESSPQ